ncbi:hypothetical protein ACFQX6_26330 [Streptosporangium lutulentum]
MHDVDQPGDRQVGAEHAFVLATANEFFDTLSGSGVQLTDAPGGKSSLGCRQQRRGFGHEGPAGVEQPGQGIARVAGEVKG